MDAKPIGGGRGRGRDSMDQKGTGRGRTARRVVGLGLAAVLLAGGTVGQAVAAAAAAQDEATGAPIVQDEAGGAVEDQLVPTIDPASGVELPPTLGETDLAVYVRETGHTIGGVMLDYWRATGAGAGFGAPISEPFAAANGYYSQAFERGVFQYRPDVLFTDEPIVRLMPVGRTALNERVATVRGDGKRANGGGDRRAGAWRAMDPGAAAAQAAVADGGLYVEETGHTVSGAFLEWYERHEGAFYLGNPLGEPVTERGRTVQWFEGGLLMGGSRGVELAPLPAEMAPALGIETERVGRAGLPDYAESLFLEGTNPNWAARAETPGAKRIEVDLSEQRLWAYQGDDLVTTTLVTTGLEPNTTEQGRFRVRLKYPEQDMAGFTSSTGEVVATDDGSGAPVPGAVGSYEVTDVPDVMYFNMEAEALHGAYWRDNFGETGSHGCINLPLEMATFLYGWAPLGTPVWVHE